MASGAMDVPKVYEDDLVFAIRDIQPRAPVQRYRHRKPVPQRPSI
jgi:hypothetical protein